MTAIPQDKSRICLVTGANRGIGLETCRQLAHLGHQVILTSRDDHNGRLATEQLATENLKTTFHPLDVTNEVEINRLYDWVLDTFGRLDVLINNAGIYPDEGQSILTVTSPVVRKTFDINFFGPLAMCQSFVPLMQRHNYGRVVNVSSAYGSITRIGGHTGAYKCSKVALNAMTRVLADELRNSNIKINAADPGWVHTEMGGPQAPRSPKQGADTIVWLATLSDDGPTNGFFYERQPAAW